MIVGLHRFSSDKSSFFALRCNGMNKPLPQVEVNMATELLVILPDLKYRFFSMTLVG